MKLGLRALLAVPTLCCLLLAQCVSSPEQGATPEAVGSVSPTTEPALAQALETLPVEPPEPSLSPALKAEPEPPRLQAARSFSRRVPREKAEEPLQETYSASLRLGTVFIMDGTRRVATCRTAALHVEEARFIERQKQIVVKSRDRSGPATVQLFDTRTGAERDAVMAHEIRNGQPAWAAGLED